MNTKLDRALDATCLAMLAVFCAVTKPIEWLDDRIGPIPTVVVGLAVAIAVTHGLGLGLQELRHGAQSWLGASDPLQ